MKTNKQQLPGGLFRVFSLTFLTLLLVQCTGPEGPMGPQGPQGYDGIDGVDGTAYAYSVIYDVEATEWIGDVSGYRAWLDVPEITDDIYYEGAVLVYRLIETEPKSFNLLPYTYVDDALFIYMDFDAYVGGIDLIYKEVFEGVNDTFAPESLMSFKVLIIEGIPLTTLKGKVNVSDFGAVAKFLKTSNIDNKEIRIN
ncbi:MAG: hypothetical protein JW830_02490 [Bacteroidales bacterium]|nr:hypothetical protein [Bacteroidales bacterium]